MYERILVPVDGSHTSTLGLQQAVKIASEHGAQIRVISIVDEFVVAMHFEGALYAGDLMDALRSAAKRAIDNAMKLMGRHGVRADSALLETTGHGVSDAIVREARKWKADLIVMGTHGRRGFDRMVLGSDAEAVLRTSPIPVLMVRSPDVVKRAKKKKS